MAKNAKNRAGQIIATSMIGLVIIGFMFTGYETYNKSGADMVAKVGNIPIKINEFQRAFNQQRQYWKYRLGGKSLTNKQIEQFQIRSRTLERLIQEKLLLKFADEIGIHSAPKAIIEEIKKIPAFKSGKRFDVKRYKLVLSSNQITPSDFEDDISYSLQSKALRELMNYAHVSSKYLNEMISLKSRKINIDVIQLNKRRMEKFIPITSKEIQTFLKNPTSLNRVKSFFKANQKSKYDVKEQVKASHILLLSRGKKDKDVLGKASRLRKKLTTKNFSILANKESQDPGNAKKKGGNLGWFSRGKMVKAFEKKAFSLRPGQISQPIKTSYGYHIIYVQNRKKAKVAVFGDFKNTIATSLLQKDSYSKLKKLLNDLRDNIKNHLKSKQSENLIDKLKAKYKFSYYKNSSINILDGAKEKLNLRQDQIQHIFSANNKFPKVFTFENPLTITILKANKTPPKEKNKKTINKENERKNISKVLSRKRNLEIIKSMKSIYPPKRFLNTNI